MNLTRPSEVRALLDQLAIRPNRTLGQNFLIDANILHIMLEAAELKPEDRVLEIGPGLGVLTEGLLAAAERVVAVEKDRALCAHLRERFSGSSRLELIEGDAMELDADRILAGVNKVAANLPYSIGSRLLVTLIESPHAPERIVVTVQLEVAERLASPPRTKDYGLLTILAQLRYAVRIHKKVRPSCFLPAPDVTSAIVILDRLTHPPAVRDPEQLRELVKHAFSRRRKQLTPVLKAYFGAEGIEPLMGRLGIDARARPEELAPVQWAELANELPWRHNAVTQ